MQYQYPYCTLTHIDLFLFYSPPFRDNLIQIERTNSHNMDATETFMLESTQFFVRENLPRFLRGQTLLNPVDKKAGY